MLQSYRAVNIQEGADTVRSAGKTARPAAEDHNRKGPPEQFAGALRPPFFSGCVLVLREWRHEIMVITFQKHSAVPLPVLHAPERLIAQENIILSVSLQVPVCILAYSEGRQEL